MFYVTMFVGIAFFIYFILDILPKAKKDYKLWRKNYMTNTWPKLKEETMQFIKNRKPLMIILIISVLILSSFNVMATNYTFSSENVLYGTTSDSANRNTEDGNVETITEADQLTDVNYSADSDSMTRGTSGYSGGASAFPDAINSIDDQYRTYIESDYGSSATSTTWYKFPNGDSSVNWDTIYPVSPTTHYDKIDEPVYDSGTTYIETGTNGDIDIFSIGDITSSEGDFSVQLFVVHYKGTSQPCTLNIGIYIGTTYYSGLACTLVNGVYTNQSSSTWNTNPSTSSEWTVANINALLIQMQTSDASPSPRVTQFGVKITVSTPAVYDYEVSGEIDFSGVESGSVELQGKCSDSENLYIQLWDYTASAYNTRITLTGTSDADYSYELVADEIDGSGNVNFHFVASSESSDSTASTFYIDYLVIYQIKTDYNATVDFTCSSVPIDCNLTLYLKGYTDDSESWNILVWNYTNSDWDSYFTVTTLVNSIESSLINCTHHVSTSTTIVRLINEDTPDIDQSSFLLDIIKIVSDETVPEPEPEPTGPIDYNYILIGGVIIALIFVIIVYTIKA
jgi:hypothetical protein